MGNSRQQLHHEGVDTTLLRDTSEHLTALVLLGVSRQIDFH